MKSRLLRLTASTVLLGGLLAAAAAASAETNELPVVARGNQVISGRIDPTTDVDRFTVFLAAGDRLKATSKEARPSFGLFSNLAIADPAGIDVTSSAVIKGQGKQRATMSFTATTSGIHTIALAGRPLTATTGGSVGTYQLSLVVQRAKVLPGKFIDPAGGSIAIPFEAPADSSITITAGTLKGGFDLTALVRPDGTDDPGFAAAVVAKSSRRAAKVKAFPLTGGDGAYQLRGQFDAGSKVTVKVVVAAPGKSSRQITDDEPHLDSLVTPFPSRGIAGTVLNVAATHLDDVPVLDDTGHVIGHTFASFWLGDIAIPPGTVSHPNGAVYTFPVPSSVVVGQSYDLTALNADGQGSVTKDAFFVVPPPFASGFSIASAGPLGGRHVRISGGSLRQTVSVLFGATIVQPELIHGTYLDVVAPAHVPGEVQVTVRDEFGQSSTIPDPFTYLDIPSNRITSVAPLFLQGLGGQTVTVTGQDFGLDTVLTLDDAAMDATRLSGTQLQFTAPPHADATVDLRVTDSYEQTFAVPTRIKGFVDASATAIPAPVTTSGEIDSWRAARVLTGDMDRDGHPDLLLLRPGLAFGNDANRPRLRMLLGSASGTFTDSTATNVPVVAAGEDWRARDGVLLDIDGDGDLDLAIVTDEQLAGGTTSSLRILKNDGSGVLTDATAQCAPALTTYGDVNQGVAIAAADLDGTHGPDLVVLHTGYFTETIIQSGGPPPPPPDPPPPDIVTINYYAGTRVLLNDGTGVFSRKNDALPAVTDTGARQYQGDALAVGDLDGDGDRDILLTRTAPVVDPANQTNFLLTASLLRNSGTAVFTDVSAARLPAKSDPEYLQGGRLVLGDLDGDGDLDLVVTASTRLVSPVTGQVSTAPAVRLFRNSSGTFSALTGVLPDADDQDSLQAESLAVGDLTGDAAPELVFVSARAPNASGRGTRVAVKTGARWNDGSKGLLDPLSADDMRGSDAALVDVDSDGDLDLVIVRDEVNETVRNTRVLTNPSR